MKGLLIKAFDRSPKRRLSLLALLTLFAVVLIAGASCIDGTSNDSSDDPINTGIIAFLFSPDGIFGNASSDSEVQATTEIFPPGSSIEFGIAGSPTGLQESLRGCLINADTVLDENGQAFADFFGGINIVSSEELLSDEPPIGIVNIRATVMPPGGDSESDFGQIFLFPVGIIPPERIDDLVTNPADDPTSIFVPLEFRTRGLPPGTVVNFSLSRPDLGSLMPTSAPVTGSEDTGFVATQYTTVNNTGGAQVVTATAVLPNPFDIDPSCPNVPEGQRTIEESVVITQSVPTPSPSPSPS